MFVSEFCGHQDKWRITSLLLEAETFEEERVLFAVRQTIRFRGRLSCTITGRGTLTAEFHNPEEHDADE